MSKQAKCCVCGGYINFLTIDIEHNKDILYYQKRYYHKDCLFQNRTKLKKGAWTQEKWDKEYPIILKQTKQYMSKPIYEKRFYSFLSKNYDIVTFSKRFCMKINQLQKGTYPHLLTVMPIEDLFDMWQQKINFLNKIYAKNKNNGKIMNGEQRLNYDLAILINKYDSYLAWKQRKKENQEKIKQEYENKQNQIDYSKIPIKTQKVSKNNSSNDIDINSILDEI
jgi:hypothetical protein